METKPVIYTEEFVKNELAEILAEILANEEVVYKGQIFEKKAYSSQRYSEWAEKFKNNEEISETIKRIDGLLETRVNVGGLKGKLNPTMTIFNLKNNYGWRDRHETDVTSGGERIVLPMPPELIEKHDTRLSQSPESDSEGHA